MKRLAPSAILLVVLACCLALNIFLAVQGFRMRQQLAEVTKRLSTVENAVDKRNAADPLQAEECLEVGTGNSPDKPCMTTVRRLALVPQQYHDRWVVVRGLYAGGFELSALFEEREDRSIMAPDLDSHKALWVQLGLPDTPKEMQLITVTGKFRRGPSGHLREFFGELVDAKRIGGTRSPATR